MSDRVTDVAWTTTGHKPHLPDPDREGLSICGRPITPPLRRKVQLSDSDPAGGCVRGRNRMTDRLREALEVQQWVCDAFDDYMLADEGPNAVDDARFELLNRFLNGGESATHTLAAAARRFLALTETGQEYRDIDYCVEHFESAWSPDECWKQVYGEDDHYVPWDSPCRIVHVQLIPADYLTEEETKWQRH